MTEPTKINERRFYPLLASTAGSEIPQTEKEGREVWNTFDKLPEDKRRVLLSSQIIEKLFQAEKNLRLSPEDTNKASLSIRKLFFGQIQPQDLQSFVGNEMSEYIKKEILTLSIPPEPLEEEADEH